MTIDIRPRAIWIPSAPPPHQIPPASTNLVLAYLGQHVLGMERSY